MTVKIRPILTQIAIYPIKSLDGKMVDRAKIAPGGALEFDRRWAIVDDKGKIVNAKRTAKIQQLRSQFDFDNSGAITVTLKVNNEDRSRSFDLNSQNTELAIWLSEFFGFTVSLIENADTGFPDDLNAYGPTIVSTATLTAIATWFPALDLAEVRRRFRTNLELSGVPAFWEDRLFGAPGDIVDVRLGNIHLHGINPCQRCIVPTRDSHTGEALPQFQQIFTHHRQQTLPPEVNPARFNHFYRLAVNTQIPLTEAGKSFATGDELSQFSLM
jgi:uncharacterized protein